MKIKDETSYENLIATMEAALDRAQKLVVLHAYWVGKWKLESYDPAHKDAINCFDKAIIRESTDILSVYHRLEQLEL